METTHENLIILLRDINTLPKNICTEYNRRTDQHDFQVKVKFNVGESESLLGSVIDTNSDNNFLNVPILIILTENYLDLKDNDFHLKKSQRNGSK